MKKINFKKIDWEKELDTCLHLLEAKEDAEYALTTCEDTLEKEITLDYASEQDYVNAKCGSNPLKNQSYSVSKPEKGKFLFSLVAMLVFFAACIGTLIASFVCSANQSTFTEMRKTPDTAYEQWADGWDSVSSFNELEDTWYIVQNEWGKRGLTVTWNDVLASKQALTRYSSTIYSGELYKQLCADMANKMSEQEGTMQFLAIFSLIPAVVFAIITKKRGVVLRCDTAEYNEQEKRNRELELEYNQWKKDVEKAKTEYVRLRKKVAEQQEELAEEKQAAKKRIKELQVTINKLTEQCNKASEKVQAALIQLGYDYDLDSSLMAHLFEHLEDNNFERAAEICYQNDDLSIVVHRTYQEELEQEEAAEERRREKRERDRQEQERIKREEEYVRRFERQAELDRQSREHQAELDRREREKQAQEAHRRELERQREQHRREVDERLKRESEQRALISSMCRRCKNYGKCGISVKTPNCHGFVLK